MNIEVIERIKKIYEEKGNIMEFLRGLEQRNYNTSEDIMISYDFQAGTYNKAYMNNRELYEKYHCEISENINRYIHKFFREGTTYRILEAGIGEGTTFGPVMGKLDIQPECGYGFDISWSRVKECIKFLDKMDFLNNRFVFVGDIFSIPMKDNSVDIVYTAHALEPNGGKEKELLKELYRVAGKCVILFEPSYEFADEKQRERMEFHGYVRNLPNAARELGYDVIENRLLENSLNNMNPTAITVICKDEATLEGEVLCDPISKGNLIKGKSSYFSKDCLVAYPVIEDIPCLNLENAILATKYI